MNTVLTNDLKLVGFDVDTFSKGPSIYRIVMVEQDPTGRVEPFTSKEEMSEVFIKESGSLCFSVSGLQIGNNLISADILENDPSKIFENIFSNIGVNEVIMYLNLDFVGTYFLKQLRRYAEKNDMRFYILSRQILPAKYSFVSDFCCQYRPDGEFVVTSNKIGPTTNVLNCSLPVEKFEPSKPQYGRQVTIKEEHTWMSDKFKKQGAIRSQMEQAKPHPNKNTYIAPIIVKSDDTTTHPQAAESPRKIMKNLSDVLMYEHYDVKESEEKQATLEKPEPLDFNVISPMEQYININYRGESTTIYCDTVQETLSTSNEVTRTIEKMEKANNISVLVDIRAGKDENGRTIEYELRQNLNGSFVILRETYFGSSKISLPIKDGTMSAVEAIETWVKIK